MAKVQTGLHNDRRVFSQLPWKPLTFRMYCMSPVAKFSPLKQRMLAIELARVIGGLFPTDHVVDFTSAGAVSTN